jgi:valyl-tRNA synthetase
MRWVMDFILGVRNIRGEMNIAPSKLLPVLLQHGLSQDRDQVARNDAFLRALARLSSITWLHDDAKAPPSATALIGQVHLFIPMAGLIDATDELKRLDKEMERLRKDLERTKVKLANANFVDRAPNDVVEKERERLSQMTGSLEKLTTQRQRVAELENMP